MIKSFTGLAIFGLLGAAVVTLPGFAPPREAGEKVALAKGGQADVQPVAQNCLQEVFARGLARLRYVLFA
jgi:hypothetical protein